MSHQPEHLSAGMDGELTSEELRFLLRRLDHDRSLLLRWERFHVAASAIRNEGGALASPTFADRVMHAIGTDAVVVAAPRARRQNWLKLSAGGAIAASVAVVALMASRPSGTSPDGVPNAVSVAQVSHANEPAKAVAPVSPAPAVAPAAVPQWLSNSNPMSMTQMASYPQGDSISRYEQSISPYRVKATLPAADGSYLLLVDPANRPTARRPVREAAVAQ